MQSNEFKGFYTTVLRGSVTAIAAVAMLASGAANAQLPMPASTQFDITGTLQDATLDPACSANAHCGGTVTVQGHTIVVPKEAIAMFPSNPYMWQEVFALAPAPYGLTAAARPETGLAADDLPAPLNTYEIHVVGNRVLGGPAGADLYIAGMIWLSAGSSLNVGAGFINFIDYTLGEMRVGGTLGDSTTGARVRLNDPVGRYGRVNSPDIRFAVDSENPSVSAGTGFPMCLPRTAPGSVDATTGASTADTLCPESQRAVLSPATATTPAVYQTNITTNDPTLVGVLTPPSSSVQAPFEVGDYITFQGILATDNAAAPTVGPWPLTGAAGMYTSAYIVVNNVGIWTAPGTNPAYSFIDVSLIGTGGLTVLGATEAVARTRFEGMTTDISRNIHLYGIDFDPATGATTDRDFGFIGVDPGAPTGAVKGRWRFRPPCLPAGSTTAKPDRDCIMNAANTFLPPPREVRAVIEGAWTPPTVPVGAPAGTLPTPAPTAANGLTWGQFRIPISLFIFQENVPGSPIVNNNFNAIPFLAQGGYPSTTGVIPGQLNPWPDIAVPAAACTAPTASAGGPYTVAAGSSVALNGTGSGTAPLTFAWAVSSGSVAPANSGAATFSALGATSPVTATLTVTNNCGASSSSTTITVDAAAAPTVGTITPLTVFSGATGSFPVAATDPQAQAVTFAVTQSPANTLLGLAVGPVVGNQATVTFTAPTVPAGSPNVVVSLSVTATNSGGTTSAPATTTVTVKPLPDVVTVTSVEYRVNKQRLIVTGTTTSLDPNVVLILNPYVTVTGAIFDPASLGNQPFVNVAGVLTLTLVGAPEPALPPATPITISSSAGGTSLPSAITKLR